MVVACDIIAVLIVCMSLSRAKSRKYKWIWDIPRFVSLGRILGVDAISSGVVLWACDNIWRYKTPWSHS